MHDPEEEKFFAEDDEVEINENPQKRKQEMPTGNEVEIVVETETPKQHNKETEKEVCADGEIDPLDAFMTEINKVIEEQKKTDIKKIETDDQSVKCKKEEEKSSDESSLDDNDATADVYEFIEKKKEELEMKGINSENEDEEKTNYLDVFLEDGKNMNDEEIIEPLDYSTIQLDPFEKDIFVTDENTMDFTLEQSVEYKKKNNITTTGFNIPKPLFSFLQIKNLMNKEILQSLYDQSYHNLSPIQSMIIPVFLSGRDFIATSRTGSGKTFSYIISLIIHFLNFKEQLLKNEYEKNQAEVENEKMEMKPELKSELKLEGEEEEDRKQEKGKRINGSNTSEENFKNAPNAIILAPTKELCFQIYEEMNRISLNRVKSCILFRGLNYYKACEQIKKGIDVIICSTRILIHFINKKIIPLQNIKYFILDEFDKLFEKQNLVSVISILKNARPDSIKGLYSSIVTDYMIERVKPFLNRKLITIKVEEKNSLITQHFVVTQENQKYNNVVKYLLIMKPKGVGNSQGIIFCNSKKNIIDLYQKLKNDVSLNPIIFDYMHGDVDQTERIRKFKNFQKKKIHILISSDLMSRGIDIVDINFVINYDCPNSIFNYVHRIGRCSRGYSRGNAVTFITLSDKKGAYNIYNYLKERNQTIDEELENFIQSIGHIGIQMNSKNNKTGKANKKNASEFINNEFLAPSPKAFKSFNERVPILSRVSFKKSATPENHDTVLKNLNVINPDDVLTSSDDD